MLFNSIQFLIFFPVVTILYFAIPYKYRWALLLTASCIFYMVFIPIYILVLLATILIDYFAAIKIEASEGQRRKNWLVLSIVSTIMVLFAFKYINFMNDNLASLAKFLDWNYPVQTLGLLLPIGLSFHTFQSLSYVIEVYRGKQRTEKHFGIYSLYVMFYPQLVAGPIERPQNLLHQFREEHQFDYRMFTSGLKLMTLGMFKKVVIADRLAPFVNAAYADPYQMQGINLSLATIFFAFQIYCDFSGYSDIAIGSARVMGFRLMENFNYPYLANSISEFWRRWHISLSTWFRDYLYIPLGGNRCSTPRWYYNLLFTFCVSGLWHGANWTYIVWGLLNGIYLVFGNVTQQVRQHIAKVTLLTKSPILTNILSVMCTFTLITFAWIFFRANNITDALYISGQIFSYWFSVFRSAFINPAELVYLLRPTLVSQDIVSFYILLVAMPVLWFIYFVEKHFHPLELFSGNSFITRWAIYYLLVGGILFCGAFKTTTQFIYFQF